jgi:hypothetical protein
MAPFLSIYTPTHRRPTLLATCRQSIQDQTIREQIQHVVVEDLEGVGIGGMFAEIQFHVGELRGQYVYVLQDDDVLAGPDVVGRLRVFAIANKTPGVVMVRNKKRSMIMPTYWGERPRRNHVDLGSYVVRQDVFAAHAADFAPQYQGDFAFIDAVWEAGWRFTWCDLHFARALGDPGLGRPEGEIEFALRRALQFATARRQRVRL